MKKLILILLITLISVKIVSASPCEDCTLVEGVRKEQILRAIGDKARAASKSFSCVKHEGDLNSPMAETIFGTAIACENAYSYFGCFEKIFESDDLFISDRQEQPLITISRENGGYDFTLKFTTDSDFRDLLSLDFENSQYKKVTRNSGTILDPDFREETILEHYYRGTCTF